MTSLQLFSTNSLGNYLGFQTSTGNFSSNYTLSFPLATDTAIYQSFLQNMSNKTLSSCTITDSSNNVTARNLETSSGTGFDVVINGTTPSGANKVLVTTSATAAGWSSIPNAALSNSSITINTSSGLSGGGTVSLGGSLTLSNTGVTGITYGVNTRTGNVTFVQGSNITITDSPAGTFTFNVPTGAGGVSSLSGGTTGLLPNAANVGALTLGGQLSAGNGGTGQTTWTTGDLLYSSASNTLSKLGIGTTGQVLTVSGGVPTWQTVSNTRLYVSTANLGPIPNPGTVATSMWPGTGVGSLTIPANTLIIGSTINFELYGTLTVGTAGTATINLLLGGSTVSTGTSSNNFATVTSGPFRVLGTVTCRSTGVTGSVIGQANFILCTSGTAQNAVGTTTVTTTTVNTTTGLALDFQYKFNNNNAGNTFTVTNGSAWMSI